MSFNCTIDESAHDAAKVYRDQEFENNPDGFHIAPWVNAESLSDAFLAGVEWRDKNPLAGVPKPKFDEMTAQAGFENHVARCFGFVGETADVFMAGAKWMFERIYESGK